MASVRKHEKGAKRRGGIKGFELAKTANSIAEIEGLLNLNREIDNRMRDEVNSSKITPDTYWEQRYITLQLEHVYNVLHVAHSKPGDMNYASAISQYARIVGVKSAPPAKGKQ